MVTRLPMRLEADLQWDCSNSGPYHHAKAIDFATTPIYWQAQHAAINPFASQVGPGFGNSTCQFPGITSAGLDDSKLHGVDFGSVYRDKLGFLPAANDTEKYAFRVTNNVITTQTLSAFAAGLYPDAREYVAWVQSETYDSLEPKFCELRMLGPN